MDRLMRHAPLCLLLLTFSGAAADVSGKWTGTGEAKLEGSASSEVEGDQRTMALKLTRVRE